MNDGERLHVVAGALLNGLGEVLLAERPAGRHLAGLWEFPGGKREREESPAEALARELQEEIGVRVVRARPFVRVRHDYAERAVLLDVWSVERWHGEPAGREGQRLRWVSPHALRPEELPPADEPVLLALRREVAQRSRY